MKGKILNTKVALQLYANNPHLTSSFGESFGKKLIAIDKY